MGAGGKDTHTPNKTYMWPESGGINGVDVELTLASFNGVLEVFADSLKRTYTIWRVKTNIASLIQTSECLFVPLDAGMTP